MRESELISVIIPCYDQGRYIMSAIESVQTQSYAHCEIIVVDDGSKDPLTISILNQLQDGVQVIHTENQGPSLARNTGCEAASGQYVLPLDADDMLAPSFIATCLSVISHDATLGAVSSWVLGFGKEDFLWKTLGGGIENFLFKPNCSVTGLIRKAVWKEVGGYDPAFAVGYEDWNFWIDMTKIGWKLAVVEEPLIYYRQKAQSRVVDSNLAKNHLYVKLMKNHPEVFAPISPHLFHPTPVDS